MYPDLTLALYATQLIIRSMKLLQYDEIGIMLQEYLFHQ